VQIDLQRESRIHTEDDSPSDQGDQAIEQPKGCSMKHGLSVDLPQENSALPECAPLTVPEAAKYLGVSRQTVYLWVERKQIPHLRVMGRNIRFLKSDLETFRASFKQEMENA
jgi:excisionase family DNA binding protein